MTEQKFIDHIKKHCPNTCYIYVGYKDGSVYVFDNLYYSVADVKRFSKFDRRRCADFILKREKSTKKFFVAKDLEGTFRYYWREHEWRAPRADSQRDLVSEEDINRLRELFRSQVENSFRYTISHVVVDPGPAPTAINVSVDLE